MKKLKISNLAPNEGVLFLYGDIYSSSYWEEDITPESVMSAVQELGNINTLHMHVNSNGGDVFAGIAIGNYLNQLDIKIIAYVDALAASIASVMLTCADEVVMYDNTMQMIHDPWTFCLGNAKELREIAEQLDVIKDSTIVKSYMRRAKVEEQVIRDSMSKESWLSAEKCLEMGLCDRIIAEEKTNNFYTSKMLNKFKNVPKNIVEAKNTETNIKSMIASKILELELI